MTFYFVGTTIALAVFALAGLGYLAWWASHSRTRTLCLSAVLIGYATFVAARAYLTR